MPGVVGRGTIVQQTVPAGGAAAIRAAWGMGQNTSQYNTAIATRWQNNYTPVGVALPPHYNNTFANVNLSAAPTVGAGWGFGAPGQPILVVRTPSNLTSGAQWIDQYTPAQVIAGWNTGIQAQFLACGDWLQATVVVQGGAPIYCEPFWECDSNSYRWGYGYPGNTIDQFNQMYRLCADAIKSRCPTVKFCHGSTGPGWGGGLPGLPGASGNPTGSVHHHDYWDQVVNGVVGGVPGIGDLLVNGGVWASDDYSNGGIVMANAAQWLVDELAMRQAFAVQYGFELGHREWGIGLRLESTGAHNFEPTVWGGIYLNWWANLPASGGGKLRFICPFDGPRPFPDSRTLSYDDETWPGFSTVDGTRIANQLKAGALS